MRGERGDRLPPRVDQLRGVSRQAARAEGPSHGTTARTIPGGAGPREAAGRASVPAVRADDRGDGEVGRREGENVATCPHRSELSHLETLGALLDSQNCIVT